MVAGPRQECLLAQLDVAASRKHIFCNLTETSSSSLHFMIMLQLFFTLEYSAESIPIGNIMVMYIGRRELVFDLIFRG